MGYDSDIIALSGCIGHWTLGEPSGNALDSKGTNPGSYVGSPTRNITGPILDAPTVGGVLLNGSTQYVSVPDANSLDLGNSLSFIVWFKRARTATIEFLGSKGSGAWHFAFNDAGPADSLALVRTDIVVLTTSPGGFPDTTSWHMATAVKAAADIRIYVDAVNVTGSVSNSTLADTGSALEFGRKTVAASGFFGGSLSRATLFNRALTPTEITTLWNTASVVSVTGGSAPNSSAATNLAPRASASNLTPPKGR